MPTDQIDKPDTTSMSLPREFAKKLKVIGDFHGLSMFEVVEKFGGPAIAREHRKVVEAMHAKLSGGES